jgi:flagellar biosynthesis regulator FlbT
MAIKIKLSSGEDIVIRGALLSDVRKAFSQALTENEVFAIRNSSGRVLALNPREILSLEEVPDAAVAAA